MSALNLFEDDRQAAAPPLEPGRHRQVFRAQEGRVEEAGLVARPEIAEHGHDGVAGSEILGQPDGSRNIDAGRAAEAQPLMFEEVENNLDRFAIGNAVGAVDDRALEIAGDAALADPFGDGSALRDELTRRIPAVKGGAMRVGNADHDIAAALLETVRDPAQRAARADGADEAADLAIGFSPDLGGREI